MHVFDANPLPGGHRFVDAPEVERIHERAVVLALVLADTRKYDSGVVVNVYRRPGS